MEWEIDSSNSRQLHNTKLMVNEERARQIVADFSSFENDSFMSFHVISINTNRLNN